jgi:hypothetical protein
VGRGASEPECGYIVNKQAREGVTWKGSLLKWCSKRDAITVHLERANACSHPWHLHETACASQGFLKNHE